MDKLSKTVYNNGDGSPKDTQTPDTQVGAWDMEQITEKTNELVDSANQNPTATEKGGITATYDDNTSTFTVRIDGGSIAQ